MCYFLSIDSIDLRLLAAGISKSFNLKVPYAQETSLAEPRTEEEAILKDLHVSCQLSFSVLFGFMDFIVR